MQRVPEPDLMNDWAQAIAYAEADFEAPHNAFIQRLKQAFPALASAGHALDLGCGPGDITMRFAEAFPHWHVDGIDGANSMLTIGKKAIQSRQLQNQISFYQVYLPEGAMPRDSYDLIFSNSLLHHLSDPLDLWRSLHALSHHNTPIFVMDLMRPESRDVAATMVDHYAAGEPMVLREDFFNSLLAAYSLDEVRTQFSQTQLSHLQLEAVSDRHWIAWGYPKSASTHAKCLS